MNGIPSDTELVAIVRRVFRPGPGDRGVAFLVDLPDEACPDRPAWRWRRELSAAWAAALAADPPAPGMEARLFAYRNVGRANADLPARVVEYGAGPMPGDAAGLRGEEVALDDVLAAHGIVIAATEHSATAPLKNAARRIPFRAATMPGFSPAMVPALRLDQDEVNRRVAAACRAIDAACEARLAFRVEGGGGHLLVMDLRHNPAHASGGLFPEPGMVGNLPSGEAYVVPWEGAPGDPSRTAGTLPVQLGDEVVVYRVEGNRAVSVEPGGVAAEREAAAIVAEPAYANLAELGLGVLGDLGVGACGDLLLDEKLGLHVAFGRSDHFGGRVGPGDFTRPDAVVHIDRVYVPRIQPRVRVEAVDLVGPDGSASRVIERDRWVLPFD
jgi:hypothetical protein